MANKRKEALSLNSIKKHVVRIFKGKWFSAIIDGRSDKNKMWNFDYAMEVLLTGLLGGAKTLREIETHSMNYDERIPDTTLENIMAKANPDKLPDLIARQIKQASRDHELEKCGLPFNQIAIDGKTNYSTKHALNDQSCEINHYGKHKKYRHLNMRAVIVSSEVKLVLGEHQIPKKSAETTELIPFVDELIRLYGKTDLMQVMSIDAGMAHRKNAAALRKRGLHFIMGLKENQKTIYNKSVELLGNISREDASSSETIEYNGQDVSYYLYRCKINKNFLSMPEICQVWRIEKESVNIKTGEVATENRYYITSIPFSEISPKQCLRAVRYHWGIENNANWTFDCQFGEDDFPLTTRAMSLISLMRILAYNCITRFKYRKLRKRENKELSWKRLFECFKFALFALRTQQRKETPTFV
jgi:hypothetical protein